MPFRPHHPAARGEQDHDTAVQYLLRLVGMLKVMTVPRPRLLVDTYSQLAGIYARQVQDSVICRISLLLMMLLLLLPPPP